MAGGQRRRFRAGLTGNQWTGTSFTDSFKRNRNPTPNELMAELKATAWTCASINAAVCASFPPRLYVSTSANQPEPKCAAKAVSRPVEQRLRAAGHLLPYTKAADQDSGGRGPSALDPSRPGQSDSQFF